MMLVAGVLLALLVVALAWAWRRRRFAGILIAAFLEQGRREAELEQRGIRISPAKRERMIRQRLSRKLGKHAHGKRVTRELEKSR